MVREETKLEWAEDSVLIDEIANTISSVSDSIKSDINKVEIPPQKVGADEKVKVEKPKESVSPPPQKSDKTKIQEIEVEFSAPKAIHLEQAYSLFNKGVLFIDARDEADYLVGHITNAINIPFDDFDNHKQKLQTISKNKPVVVYCAGTECDLSILLANLLFDEGYKQVYIFFGGWGEWLEADYPVKLNTESNQER